MEPALTALLSPAQSTPLRSGVGDTYSPATSSSLPTSATDGMLHTQASRGSDSHEAASASMTAGSASQASTVRGLLPGVGATDASSSARLATTTLLEDLVTTVGKEVTLLDTVMGMLQQVRELDLHVSGSGGEAFFM
eukprot:gene15668-21772_t